MIYKNIRKAELLNSVQGFLAHKAVIIVNLSSLKSDEFFSIRKRLWSLGGNIHVVKNSIVALALESLNLKHLSHFISNVVAFAYCDGQVTKFFRLLLDVSKEYSELRFDVLSSKVDDDFLDINLIKEFALLDDVNHVYLKLTRVLESALLSLVDVIDRSSIDLVSSLDSYIDLNSGK